MEFLNKRNTFNGSKKRWKNSGFRSLYESNVYPEVELALNDWKTDCGEIVLIGGLALTFYIKPRPTHERYLIFLTEEDIPTDVYKFEKNKKHVFLHLKTHVEVEVLNAEFLGYSEEVFKHIIDNSIESDGIKVASPESLIALKLTRFNLQDKADISQLKLYCIENNLEVDLTKYNLSDEEIAKYNELEAFNEGKLNVN